jgi:hypothetical protein
MSMPRTRYAGNGKIQLKKIYISGARFSPWTGGKTRRMTGGTGFEGAELKSRARRGRRI